MSDAISEAQRYRKLCAMTLLQLRTLVARRKITRSIFPLRLLLALAALTSAAACSGSAAEPKTSRSGPYKTQNSLKPILPSPGAVRCGHVHGNSPLAGCSGTPKPLTPLRLSLSQKASPQVKIFRRRRKRNCPAAPSPHSIARYSIFALDRHRAPCMMRHTCV